jgi:RNA polymerase-associated protein
MKNTMVQMSNRRSAMALFSADHSARSHMVRIVLAEKGINYELLTVNDENNPEELKDLNPYNDVPTLVDRDLVLFQHQVIVEYLDERFPHPPLMPVDPVSRARNRLMLYRVERDWYSLVDIIVRNDKDSDNARKALRDSLLSAMAIFEQKTYFLSDEFNMLDCAMAPMLWRLPWYGVQLPTSAKALTKYADRVFSRASFRTSMTEVEKDMR